MSNHIEVWEWPRPPLEKWPVHAEYRWGADREGSEAIEAVGPIVKTYDVAQDGGLLARFLDTRGLNDGVLDFVRQQGLGGFPPFVKGESQGESLFYWQHAYAMLRNVKACVYARETGREPHPDLWHLVSEPWRPGRKATPAMVLAREQHDLPLAAREFALHLRLVPGRNEKGFPVVEHKPMDLVGVMWKQMLKHFTGELDWKVCRGCSEPMPIGTDRHHGKRHDAEFHSPECRARFTNRWRSAALELHRSGKPISTIARRIGVEANRIEMWLATANRQSRRRKQTKQS